MSLGICFICNRDTDLLCSKCEQFYCLEHSSIFNTRLCLNCGPNTSLGLESEALVDDKGVTHQGRRIKLIGEGWPEHIEKISDLTDEELGEKIVYFRNLIKDVARTRDTLTVTLSAMESESINRRAKNIRINQPLAQGLHISSNKTTDFSLSPEEIAIRKLAKTMNLDLDKARLVYKSLRGI